MSVMTSIASSITLSSLQYHAPEQPVRVTPFWTYLRAAMGKRFECASRGPWAPEELPHDPSADHRAHRSESSPHHRRGDAQRGPENLRGAQARPHHPSQEQAGLDELDGERRADPVRGAEPAQARLRVAAIQRLSRTPRGPVRGPHRGDQRAIPAGSTADG